MRPTRDPLLEMPWVAELSRHVRAQLGYDIPPHRLVREIVPFTVAESEIRGLPRPSDLVYAMLGGREPEFWESLVDLTTIGETYFFRHPDQIEAIAAWAVRRHRETGRPLAVWSAGCATGEEPYSLAMRLETSRVPCSITATDLSRAALRRAEAGGPYSDRSVGHLPEPYRIRWLEAEGPGRWHLRERSRFPVRFGHHNLVREAVPRPASGAWDLVLCRNVAIYFSREEARRVVETLAGALAPSGSLWIAPCDAVDVRSSPLVWSHEGDQRYLARGDASRPSARPVPAPPRAVPAPPRGAAPAAAWIDDLRARLARGLIAGAAEVIEQRLAAHPDDGTAWVARAAIQLRDHHFEAALEALDRAARTHPRPEGLAYLRGTTLLKMGRPDAALVAFLEAVRDEPDDWASSWQAADLYRRQGRELLEEMMLRRTAELLDAESPPIPPLGPAADVVNSVHRDGGTILGLVRARLGVLARAAAHTRKDLDR